MASFRESYEETNMTTREPAVLSFSKITTRGTIILAIIGFGILTASCRPSAATVPPVETEYIGSVIDGESQQPIMGAKVSLDLGDVPLIDYADTEGIYRFRLTINSTIIGQLKVEAQGYETYTRNISITADDKNIADIRLTPQPMSSFTFTPEPASTSTSAPPATSTLQVLTLAERCIFSETWRVHSLDSNSRNSVVIKPNGCYDMGLVGIFADNTGVLRILDRNKTDTIVSGIVTPINNDSVIEFNIFVNSMYLPYVENGPVFASFAIASAANPLDSKNTARFKLQVDTTTTEPPVIFVLADAGENNGAPVKGQHYGYGNTYAIRLELTGVMEVYINNKKMNESLGIPTGPKVFYIGYNLPSHASIDVNVSEIKIDGVLR
jgi:hypothetical protein